MTEYLKKYNLENIIGSAWNKALIFTCANAVIYLFFSLFVYLIDSGSVTVITSVSTVFLLGSIASFLFLVRAGGVLAPITWFTLGSGIFFGFGNFVGNLHVDPYAHTLFGNSFGYMLKNNIINSSTVFIVVIIASLFSFTKVDLKNANIWIDNKAVLEKILNLLLPMMLFGLLFRFYNMGVDNSLVIAGVIQKSSKLLISTAFLAGLLWIDLKKFNRLLVLSFLLAYFTLGVLLLSKYEILVGPLCFTAGLWCRYSSFKLKVISSTVIFALLYFFNPIVTLSRRSMNYNFKTNTSIERLVIVKKTIQCHSFKKNCDHYPKSVVHRLRGTNGMDSGSSGELTTASVIKFGLIERLKGLALRFDTATVQGFLTKEYESGVAGKSLSTFWEVFIPRFLWSKKPNVSRYGQALYALMYNVTDTNIDDIRSSVAPTFNAESYWNYGFTGLLSASIIFGLIIGLMNLLWIKAMSGKFVCYFVFAMQIALWAMYIESWFAATILGEIVIISSMLTLFHFSVKAIDLIIIKIKSMDLAINS
ncbi:MAG: hypothetical protein NDI63_06840 [Pseudobdellovibrio sp.]|nr:hypothetical protein [Pseudobdellovibrio sp.]